MFWLELFYDLAFIGALTAVADQFEPNEEPGRTLAITLALLLLASIWTATTFALNRSDEVPTDPHSGGTRNHVLKALVVFVQMVAISTGTLEVIQASGGNYVYGWSALAVALGTVVLLRLMNDRPGQPLLSSSRTAAAIVGIAAVVALIAVFESDRYPPPWQFLLILVLVAASIEVTIVDRRRSLNLDHLKERFGALNLIAIGSVFLALSVGLEATGDPADATIFFACFLFPLVTFVLLFGPAAPIGTAAPIVRLWVLPSALLAMFILVAGTAVSRRAIEAGLDELVSGQRSVAFEFGVILFVLAVLSIAGKRVPPAITVAYGVGGLVLWLTPATSRLLGLQNVAQVIILTGVFTVVALAITLLAMYLGRETDANSESAVHQA